MYEMVEIVAPRLPKHKPRYLMGVGTPANLLENIARGVDMFDCVMPTRNGRNGMIFTTQGIINIRNKKWERDTSAIDPGLENTIAQGYSKAYLRHLFVAKEILGLQLASVQNLAFYLWLMREARQAIMSGTYYTWMQRMLPVVSTRL
jgi:queuine tRNA-ribosyltransferase